MSEFWKPRPKLSCTGLYSLSLANWLKGSLRNLTSKLKVVKIDRGVNITVSTSPVKG